MRTKKDRKLSPREINAIDTKKKIYDVAISLFAEREFDDVTIDEITTIAGVSKGTFYTHFENKEAVTLELFYRIDKYYLNAFHSLSPDTSASERILLLVDTSTSYCINICGLTVIKTVYAHQITNKLVPKLLPNKERPIFTILRDAVKLGKASGEFKFNMDSHALAEVLIRQLRGLIYDWCLYDGKFDLQVESRNWFIKIIEIISSDLYLF